MSQKTIAKNRRAYFDYTHIDTFTAGVSLLGHEVKSIRMGNIDLNGSFVTIQNEEAWLTNAHIKQYPHANDIGDYDPTRSRKLLLQKSELSKIIQARESKLTIIPLAVILSGPYIKIIIATARGKKLHDKRKNIQKRDTDRDTLRELKSR